MHDLRDELAGLVADVAATLEALRLQGTIVLPKGAPLPALPEVEPPALRAAPSAPIRSAPPPRPEPAPSRPAPAYTAPPAPPRLEPTPSEPPPSGGLLGGWASRLSGPEDRLSKVVAALGATCPSCGEPTLTGVGGVKSGLVLLADRCTESEQAVLANMLVRVVGVEPEDVWTTHARPCPACVGAIRRQVEAIKPRVALVLGPLTRTALSLETGVWGELAGAPALATFHPSEFAADAGRKRPAFSALQDVAARR